MPAAFVPKAPAPRPHARAPARCATRAAPRMQLAPTRDRVAERVVEKVVEKERAPKTPGMYRLYILNDPFNTRVSRAGCCADCLQCRC